MRYHLQHVELLPQLSSFDDDWVNLASNLNVTSIIVQGDSVSWIAHTMDEARCRCPRLGNILTLESTRSIQCRSSVPLCTENQSSLFHSTAMPIPLSGELVPPLGSAFASASECVQKAIAARICTLASGSPLLHPSEGTGMDQHLARNNVGISLRQVSRLFNVRPPCIGVHR